MNAKPKPGIDRREALKRMGAAGAAVPLLTFAHHPLVPVPQGERWSARALGPSQLETLLALAERIIPETETPGARGAMAHQYVDYVVSEDEERKEALTAALDWFDRASGDAQGAAFSKLQPERQIAILESAAERGAPGHAHFAVVKQLTVEGYYRSEVGMIDELDYQGTDFLGSFDGCQHPEHQTFTPEARRAKEGGA